MPTSDEGADDIGEDIELGNWNHCIMGTEFELDLPDGADVYSDSAVLVVGPSLPKNTGIPVNGIQAVGTAGGSALLGTVFAGGGAAIIGQTSSSTNPGVLGTNDMGTGVSGISNAAGGFGVFGRCDTGSGIGIVGESSSPVGAGVAGNCDLGTGVSGTSLTGTGVSGTSTQGTGVSGGSPSAIGWGVSANSGTAAALVAQSTNDRGGIFSSGSGGAGPVSHTTQGGIAQLRLVPSKDGHLPTKAFIGDLYAHLSKSVNLYLCVNDSPVQWKQVQLGATVYAGGQSAP
jgi:hypothetical protein